MSNRRRVAIAALALLAGAAFFAGGWIHVKAALAQVLLRVAWERTARGATDARPWPWADTHPVARISINDRPPLIVLADSSGRTMAFAPGHVGNTALPGDDGNCVIGAHRDTHFAALRHVARGDRITAERPDGRTFTYVVEETRIVDEHDAWIAGPRGAPVLTLVTCWPFDAIVPGGPQRYVVVARLAGQSSRSTAYISTSRHSSHFLSCWRSRPS